MPNYYPLEYNAINKTCHDQYVQSEGMSDEITAYDNRFWKVSSYEEVPNLYDVEKASGVFDTL